MNEPKCFNPKCPNYNSQQLTIAIADPNIKFICLGCDYRWKKKHKEEKQ